MSAVQSEHAHGTNGSPSTAPTPTSAAGPSDLSGILAGRIANLYAASERERRHTNVERAIARARGSA